MGERLKSIARMGKAKSKTSKITKQNEKRKLTGRTRKRDIYFKGFLHISNGIKRVDRNFGSN